jgi:MFS family permease
MDLGSIAGLQAMPSFLRVFGYPDPSQTFGYGIDPEVQRLISSLMSIGAIIGCGVAGPLSKVLTRKWVLVIGVVINQMAVILMIACTDLSGLYAGRVFIGVSNGLFDVIPQLYIHECSPPHLRAPLLGMFTILVSVGLLVLHRLKIVLTDRSAQLPIIMPHLSLDIPTEFL